MNDISLILKALEFAAQRHGTQLRKGKNNYIYLSNGDFVKLYNESKIEKIKICK